MSFQRYISNFTSNIKGNFFFPGHKGRRFTNGHMSENLTIDVTEFPETDDLANPRGIIRDAEIRIAEIFGVRKSHILVNGSTVGIQAMLLSTLQRGDIILTDPISHRSVFGGIKLAGATPILLERNINKEYSSNNDAEPVCFGFTRTDIEKAVSNNPKAKGVILTSPTYYGVCSDIAGIAELLHKKHMFLLVDEAHGAHFPFNNSFPLSAIKQGADIAVNSVHKTLPAPTQTALLHEGESAATLNIKDNINLLQTTSPSYILMSGLIDGIESMEHLKDHYEQIILLCKDMLWDTKRLDNDDITRIVINFKGLTGEEAANKLRSDYGVYPERFDGANVIFVVTAHNTEADLALLRTAVTGLFQ